MNQAEKNAEIVRRGYDAFNAADVEALTQIFHEDASWHTPGHSSVASDSYGRDAVFAHFDRYSRDTAGTFKAALEQVFTSTDGRVIGLHRANGVRNGRQIDTGCCIVFEVENGRITSGREHFYDLDDWDQFWS